MNHSYVLAIHGGAGTIAPDVDNENQYHAALKQAMAVGEAVLYKDGSAVDAAVVAVAALEDCPLFNAGRGSVYTSDAIHEMDASVMDGRNLAAGAVACVKTVKNPIHLARAVMRKSDCVLLVSEGAERFARECGIETVAPSYFATDSRMEQLLRTRTTASGVQLDHDAASGSITKSDTASRNSDEKLGTVGAVARDREGNLAAAVSTGGLTNKRPGRVGDTPIIGAGCYADNRTVTVASTGTGEYFIRTVAAYDIAARIEYGNCSLAEAAQQTIFERVAALGGCGGVIALDRDGNLAMPFNTAGMYRAWVRENENIATAIF
jgi:beta-aspartyl-peptidase (threonine type)